MRNITLLASVAAAAMFAMAQTASAERVCKEICDGGTCMQKCIEHDDPVVIDRDGPPPRPGIGVHVPGVDVDIGH
jgi:hypothetical protein